MILFCPTCSNMLLLDASGFEQQSFFCQTCPYATVIQNKYSHRVELQRKAVDDVLGGSDAWANVDATDATCPKCENTRAYYMQIQLRSADEPSSIFYRCCNAQCNHQWREG